MQAEIQMNVDGFNGIVDIGWDGVFQILMLCRLDAGKPLHATQVLLRKTVVLVIILVDPDNVKHCYNGLTILIFNICEKSIEWKVG